MIEREATVLDEHWEVKRVAIAYEVALRLGDAQVSIEQWMIRHAELPRKELLLALIETEFTALSQEHAAKAAYQQRFPGFSEDIETLLRKSSAPIPTPLAAGDRLGDYVIVRLVGRGAIGFVFLAEHTQTKAQVAIKILRVDQHSDHSDDYRDLFAKEAVVNQPLVHPQIVRLLSSGEHGQLPYHVFEYIDGQTLEAYIENRMIDSVEAARIIADIAEAVHFSHRCGVVHRDLKPSNILLDKHGRPHVTDFGIALDHSDLGTGASFIGTPLYMSPEQVRGSSHHLDGRSDIFSLGVMLYQMTTGVHPFQPRKASQYTLKHSIEHIPAPPLRQRAEVPQEFDQICMKALAKDPIQRFNTAGDFAKALRHYSRHKTRRNSWALVSCAGLLLLAASMWALWSAADSIFQVPSRPQTLAETTPRSNSAAEAVTSVASPTLSATDIANLDSSIAAMLPEDSSQASPADIQLVAALLVAGLKTTSDGDTKLWEYFGAASDNTLRTALIHLCPVAGLDPQRLVDRALIEPRSDIRAALLMAIGSYPEVKLSPEIRQELVAQVLEWYCLDPQAEMHSVCEWLLRRWGEDAQSLHRQLRFAAPSSHRQWFTTLANISMIACYPSSAVEGSGSPAPVPGQAGQPSLAMADADPVVDFAISAYEVTGDQWAWVMGERGSMPAAASGPPQNGLSWHQCAEFCNHLSTAVGLTSDQLCYEKLSQDYFREVPDAQLRVGFRMPTLAEWNYAARGTTTTARYWGRSDHFLKEYANCRPDSLMKVMATGSLKPNGLGLFDTLGNLTEWLHGIQAVGSAQYDFAAMRSIRGGSAWTGAMGVNVDAEYTMASDLRSERMGLRIVHSLPGHHLDAPDLGVELLTIKQVDTTVSNLSLPAARYSLTDRFELRNGTGTFLGILQRGDSSSRELVITNNTSTALNLHSVISSGCAQMLNDAVPAQPLKPKESIGLPVTIQSTGRGRQTASIAVTATAVDGQNKTYTFPIEAFISGPAIFSLEGNFDTAGIMRLELGRVAPGTASRHLITLSNIGDQALKIAPGGITGLLRTIRLPIEQQLNFQQHAYIEFEIKPTTQGPFSGGVQIETNDAVAPQIQIEVTGEAVELPLVPVFGVFRDGLWRLDYNRDGKPDQTIQFGEAGDKPCAGDFDGDGTVELAVIRRVDDQQVAVHIRRESPEGQIQVTTRSLEVGDGQLVVGDFNADGRSDFACVTSGTSGLCKWQVDWDEDGKWDDAFEFGLSADEPLSGDWLGTGSAQAAVLRHSSTGGLGQWFKRTKESSEPVVVHFGLNGDQPIAGDWNGDGVTDIGIYRFQNGSGAFLLDLDADPAGESYVKLGDAGDVPICFMAPPMAGL